MNTTWEISVWGVRGSFPMADRRHMDYGGNTSCISVRSGEDMIVLDAGSGLIRLWNSLKTEKELHIFISHLHMDHICGLFGSPFLLDKDRIVHFYGPAGLRNALKAAVRPPYWPVSLKEGGAALRFHEAVSADAFFHKVGDVCVSAMNARHPGGGFLYRLDGAGKSLVYALDYEADGQETDLFIDFASGCDLLVWDAAYDAGAAHPGWGHSTLEDGIRIGRMAGVGRILMSHYSWEYDDERLHAMEERVREKKDVVFAREGLVFEI